jgi:hypothetical protein
MFLPFPLFFLLSLSLTPRHFQPLSQAATRALQNQVPLPPALIRFAIEIYRLTQMPFLAQIQNSRISSHPLSAPLSSSTAHRGQTPQMAYLKAKSSSKCNPMRVLRLLRVPD